jgi:hypothetical protein
MVNVEREHLARTRAVWIARGANTGVSADFAVLFGHQHFQFHMSNA